MGPDGTYQENPAAPQVNQAWKSFLLENVGKGADPFNLTTNLPTGGTTVPGQLTAGMNPTLQQILDYFNTGKSSNTGISALDTLAQGTSAIPQWQADIAAQKQNIEANQANLKEQFASTGALGSSEYGKAMGDYMQGTTASQNALLAQIQQQNQQTQLAAGQSLTQLQSDMGQVFQGMDQQAIQNMLQEFIRTNPDYSPLLQYIYGQANVYNPLFTAPQGQGQGSQYIQAGIEAAMLAPVHKEIL